MKYKRLENGEFVDIDVSQLIDGDRIKKEVAIGVWAEMNYSAPVPDKTKYTIENIGVINDVLPAAITLSGDYDIDISVPITVSCDIVGGGALDYGAAVIKVPLVRFADDSATDDEIYFTASIVAGHFVATGVIPRSGDWRLLSTRVNKALDRINAGWHIDADKIGLLA